MPAKRAILGHLTQLVRELTTTIRIYDIDQSSLTMPAPGVSARRSSIRLPLPDPMPLTDVVEPVLIDKPPSPGRCCSSIRQSAIVRWGKIGCRCWCATASIKVSSSRLPLDLYGAEVFAKAVADTVERGTHDPGEVGVLCEKHRRAAEHPVPIHVPLSDGVPDRDVIPHDLGGYDAKR